MDHMKLLENESLYIIREAFSRCRNSGMLWSIGKRFNNTSVVDQKSVLWKNSFSHYPYRHWV